jgi:cytochrome c-type biogenesis protein CcmH
MAEALSDPRLEARVAAIAAELRCLVCQNQTIADSNAELALDLRRIIREQLTAGRSEREVLDFMAARYGDLVLYRPPLKPTTALLWGGPALMVALGGAALWFTLRRRQRLPASAFDAEDPEDHDQADRQPR